MLPEVPPAPDTASQREEGGGSVQPFSVSPHEPVIVGSLSTGNLCESEGVRVREGVAAREGGSRGKHTHKNKEGKKYCTGV